MMLLQESVNAFQVGGGVLLAVNTALLLRLSFGAGRIVEKVDGIDRRVERLEDAGCKAEDCPLRKEK